MIHVRHNIGTDVVAAAADTFGLWKVQLCVPKSVLLNQPNFAVRSRNTLNRGVFNTFLGTVVVLLYILRHEVSFLACPPISTFDDDMKTVVLNCVQVNCSVSLSFALSFRGMKFLLVAQSPGRKKFETTLFPDSKKKG